MVYDIATVWVGPERLDDRVDTRPYKPWVLARIDKCRAFRDGSVCLGSKDICSFLSRGVGGGQTNPSSIAVYKAREVTGYGFSLPELFLDDAPKSKVLRHGDVVLTSSGIGTIGRADLYYAPAQDDTQPLATVDNHVTILRCRGNALSPGFLTAFLNSAYGKAWSEWGTTGSTRLLELSPSRVRRIAVPRPDILIQTFVGQKIELALRSRSAALGSRQTAYRRLSQSWSWEDGALKVQRESARTAHVVEAQRLADRLDAEFYKPRFLALDAWLDGHDCWIMADLAESPVKGVQPEYDSNGTVPALTVTHVDPFVLNRDGASGFVSESWLTTNPRARVEAGKLLVTVTGPPLGECVVVEPYHLPAVINSHVSHVSPTSSFPCPNLLAGMLNSPLGQLQTTRHSKGVRQRELYPSDFMRFRFPRISPKEAAALDGLFRSSCVLLEKSRTLINEAKSDVEALIEGTLDTKAILSGKLKPPTEEDVLQLENTDEKRSLR